MFPLLQLFLLMLTSVLVHIAITNPNRTNSSDYVPDEGTTLIIMVKLGPKVGKLFLWFSTLYQVLYLCLQAFSPSLLPVLFPQVPTPIDPLPWTSTAVLGYIFLVVGGWGRVWCHKTLGVFFTHQITIRHSHKLIRTGPYAYVRHPSYTFAVILIMGLLIVHQRLPNFFPHIAKRQTAFGPVRVLITFMIIMLFLIKRVTREEEELKKSFGQEWIEYASKTKRFLPGLI